MSEYIDLAFNLPLGGSFTYLAPARQCAVGCRVVAPFGRRSLAGFVVGQRRHPPRVLVDPDAIKPITRIIDAEPLFDERYLDLARWVAKLYLCSLGEALAAMLPGGRRDSELPALPAEELVDSAALDLSDEQIEAVQAIDSAAGGLFYLYGLTGSGKTEVFLQAAERIVQRGDGVIYLVPEIALTHQLAESVQARFGPVTAVLHSRLTPSQRLKEWKRIRRGEALVVVGARSAVFAPLPRLGMIVLDEEHEGSYKSSSTPRYHARQIAMKRCADQQARLVMGSATPSVEAWRLMQQQRIRRLTLSRRLAGGSMPVIEVVDLKAVNSTLSRELTAAIERTHRNGHQTILFLNRRGFAYLFFCRSCGYTMRCARCSVSLTFHQGRNAMVCHYCGYRTRPVAVCPDCGSLDVGYAGFGTEKVEEDVRRRFPALKIARIDADSVRKRGLLEQALSEFRSGAIDILLGTQMVAKGLNFPGVRLVGIIHADTGLALPDFRAAERTFSLIVQVAGRAGRFSPDGHVIVQTLRPGHDAIRRAAAGDMEGFYEAEMKVREQLAFPPFSRIIRLVLRGRSRGRVEEAAQSLAVSLRPRIASGAEVLGPAECPLGVISGNHRYQVICRLNAFDAGHAAVRDVLKRFTPPPGVYVEIDVDPVHLL
ncbi:MAG: primosomal protein N' [Spirochaetaceae bacterium]|nr:MAG: primosomal protein N' [Spirochaetaceae bacterium]